MSTRRLSRPGTVRQVTPECTTIEVSVPCTGCRQSGCLNRRGRGFVDLPGRTAATLLPGEPVEISVAAVGLTGVSVRLFGPAIGWTLAMALYPSGGTVAEGGLSAVAIVGLVGMVAALFLGRALTAAGTGVMDLKVIPDAARGGAETGNSDSSRK